MFIVLRVFTAGLIIGLLSSGSEAGPVEAGPGPQAVQHLRKADSLLLTEVPALVRKWTDKCLIEERNGSEPALDCWRQAAAALGPYLKDLRGPLINQVEQLQSTWLKRVEDLQSYRHAAAASAPAVVRPVSTRFNQSDPNRLAGTAMCSSRKLGDYRACHVAPVKVGDGQYQLKLKAACARGSIAAVGVTDERGRCLRRVISLSAGDRPVLVSSRAEPRVLDAIPFGKGDTYECYARRHENQSCDAASAQGDSASLIEDLPKKKARTVLRQKIRTGQAAKKALQQADKKPQRRKKVITANGQIQKRLKKSQAAEKAALAAVADKPGRRKPKGVMCILFGRNCTPNT
jgi:hypothetical protein